MLRKVKREIIYSNPNSLSYYMSYVLCLVFTDYQHKIGSHTNETQEYKINSPYNSKKLDANSNIILKLVVLLH